MFSAVLELIAYQANAVEVGAHRELIVLGLHLAAIGVPLAKRLLVKCQGKYNVASQLARVHRAIEAAQFYGSVSVEEAMQVEELVSAVMVVSTSASVVAVVPNVLNFFQGLGFARVDCSYQLFAERLAVMSAFRMNCKSLVQKVVLASDDFYPVLDCARVVSSAVQMNMNAAAVVDNRACLAKGSDDFLKGAVLALERNTGARGLRAIMENAMTEIMYEVPSRNDIARVEITPECIRKSGACRYTYRKDLIEKGSTEAV